MLNYWGIYCLLVSKIFYLLGLLSLFWDFYHYFDQKEKSFKNHEKWNIVGKINCFQWCDWNALECNLDHGGEILFPHSVNTVKDGHLHVLQCFYQSLQCRKFVVTGSKSNILSSKATAVQLSTWTTLQLEWTAIYVGAHLIDYMIGKYPMKFVC